MVPFWKEKHKVMETIFQKKIQFHFALLYLGNLESLNLCKPDKYLFSVLSVASKKAITRLWLKEDTPTIDEWIDVIYTIFVMERITFRLKCQADSFEEYWLKWLK